MKKSMECITVYVSKEKEVCIKNDYHGGSDDIPVSITPEQVDIVIQWLKEAKEEALKSE